MNLGDKIAALRKQRNLTQEDLAYKLHVSRQTVSKWETNIVLPDINNLKEIARVFEISIDELLTDDKEVKDNDYTEAIDYGVDRTVRAVKKHWLKIGYPIIYRGIMTLIGGILMLLLMSPIVSGMRSFNNEAFMMFDAGPDRIANNFLIVFEIVPWVVIVSGIIMLVVGIVLAMKDREKNKLR